MVNGDSSLTSRQPFCLSPAESNHQSRITPFSGRPQIALRLDLPQEEILHQRLLRVQSVFSLVPYDALGSVDNLGGDFLPAARRQAMQEERVFLRRPHHVPVHPPRLEVALALRILR